MLDKSVKFDHLKPDIRQWPIYELHEDRAQFVDEIVNHTVSRSY